MVTGILTFLIIFAVIGSILYGQRLIKTEKSDAVFGNPERTKGGVHWIIVGTSFIIFTWLYYSWDIAKSFYPKSANELCQVAKVNESLLSLKYLFPIEERSHKSTALIKRENINISNKIIVIQNSPSLKNQDKEKFVNLLNKTRQTIPLLTNEKYLETKTKTIINELTNRIKQLTESFPKDVYPPPLSEEDENKRIEATKKQLGWGATGMEVPPLPESKKGLKFHTAAQELNEISDEFFSMRNHNPEYLKLLKEIKDEIKEYKNGLDDNQELEMDFIKEIKKLYLKSLSAIGINYKDHDIRFVEDDWESPTLGAAGLGWEVWCDGMEITQFTYFQQMAGIECKPVSVELTYGLERICMFTQKKNNVFDLLWNDFGVKYKDIFYQSEKEFSAYNFEHANTDFLFKIFEMVETECKSLLDKKLSLPAYDQCLKASHVFNLLDSRGAIGVAQRAGYISRIRDLVKQAGSVWLETQT